MHMPPSVASRAPDTEHASFAEDVAYYLSLTPRQLPSRYFYDELGSALFETICRLPWYRITRTERAMLQCHARAILSRTGHVSTFIELGPGGGEKLLTLVAAHDRHDLNVHLVDVSPLSTIGALCLASVTGEESRRLFNQLLAWGFSMTIVGAILCYLVFGHSGWF